MTQYVECRFTPGATRGYSYRNDGEPLKAGDFVKIEGKGGHLKTVEVCALLDAKPPFECKPIVEISERPDGWLDATKGITDGQ